ncbi:NAC domain-containing protein 1-like [Solanum lycopersicum]|uniref:NAC domain-containing protein 1-like n=1 Tax=Solanum lycopersicum TaxID=4081 RepID=UPI0037499287
MKYTDEDLIRCLTKFIRGMPIDYDDIPYVDLYGDKEPAELFQNLGNNHVNYFFTQLKRKAIKGKNFNRSIVGGRKWKGRDNSKEILDRERSRIGYKKTFRFDEESGSEDKEIVYWIVKEYCLDKTTVDVLRECGEIRHEDFVVCFITKKVNLCKHHQDTSTTTDNVVPDCVLNLSRDHDEWLYGAKIWQLPPLDESFKALTDEELNYFDTPDPEYPHAYIHENKKLN